MLVEPQKTGTPQPQCRRFRLIAQTRHITQYRQTQLQPKSRPEVNPREYSDTLKGISYARKDQDIIKNKNH